MIGLAALFILCLWMLISYKISKFIYGNFKLQNNKFYIKVMIFFLIFISPLADDIVGGIQFRLLCLDNSSAFINVNKAKNKNLISSRTSENLTGYILPTSQATHVYKDVSTNEAVVQWKWFKSSGGWLSRSINFNSSDAPFTFKGSCQPIYSGNSIVKDLNINLIYQSN